MGCAGCGGCRGCKGCKGCRRGNSLTEVDRQPNTRPQVEFAQPRQSCPRLCQSRACRDRIQFVLILVAVIAGIALGLLLRTVAPFDEPELHPKALMYLGFAGELLQRCVCLLTVPLVVASIISGVASLGGNIPGKVGLRMLIYYLVTTLLALAQALCWFYIIRPGTAVNLDTLQGTYKPVDRVDAILDVVRNLMPDNIISVSFEQVWTKPVYREVVLETSDNVTGDTTPSPNTRQNVTRIVEDYELARRPGMNVLGLLVISVTFGVLLSRMYGRSRPLVDLFDIIFLMVMKLVIALMWLYPLGVMSIVAVLVVQLDDPYERMSELALFLATVLAAMATHFLIVLPLLCLIVARRNPFCLILDVAHALLTALATNDGNLTLPVTMKCLEWRARVSARIVRFMSPIGAAVNMDGYALYDALLVIFIATVRGTGLGLAELIGIGVIAVLVSLGAPSIGGGAHLHVVLFHSIGLPASDVFIIIPFDWLLGRLRAVVHVWSDVIGACIVEKRSMDDLHDDVYKMAPIPDAMSNTSYYDDLNLYRQERENLYDDPKAFVYTPAQDSAV